MGLTVYSRFWYNIPIPKSTHSNPDFGKAGAKNAQKSPEHKFTTRTNAIQIRESWGAISCTKKRIIGRKQSCGFRRIFSVAFEWLF